MILPCPYLPFVNPKEATHPSWMAKFSSFSALVLKITSGGSSSPAPLTAKPPVMWPLLRVCLEPLRFRLGLWWVFEREPLLSLSLPILSSVSSNLMLWCASSLLIVISQVTPSMSSFSGRAKPYLRRMV